MRVTKNIVLSDSNNKVATLEEFLIYLLWFEYSYFFHTWVWQTLAPLLLLTLHYTTYIFRDPRFDQYMHGGGIRKNAKYLDETRDLTTT